ncbi:dynamin family protein [Sodalinema gerasimenkoae]|uniref:dynamin family protein n=1 Tax=Sodalinema gerasimenkoae TaxID=2862348 RepID=UPI00135C983F|nr:dynamin family protein [Sodalinema gerasimenkoae]
MTGEDLKSEHVSPSVLFLAAISTLLLKVMCADGVVSEDEKRHFQTTLKQVIPSEGDLRRLAQSMVSRVNKQKLYNDPHTLQILTSTFSQSEKLLLISFGYQMSSIDGTMHVKELKELNKIGSYLNLNPDYLDVLEHTFKGESVRNRTALNKVRRLLDPSQFYDLEPIFKKAASLIEDRFPQPEEEPAEVLTAEKGGNAYLKLAQLKKIKTQTSIQGYHYFQILQSLCDEKVIPEELLETTRNLFNKLSDSHFRISVIGSFSVGKSTLLNALLGSKVQPVAAIPCTGVLSILRYSQHPRVICHYKDGTTEEIPFEAYQDKVKIAESQSETEANRNQALVNSSLEYVVFQTPDLEFCKHGAEIVDSPGLNEHPEREKVTQQLIKETDAIIFMISAQQSLTATERELFEQIRNPLNLIDDADIQPAKNIFVVVNYMDLLDNDDDDDDYDSEGNTSAVKKRIKDFCFHEQPARISGDNRVHYLSARKALTAKLKNKDNQYLQDFNQFIQSLEDFLIDDRGGIQLENFSSSFNSLMKSALAKIQNYQTLQQSNLKNIEQEKKLIWDKMGEAAACQVRFDEFVFELYDEVVDLAAESFEEWDAGLYERVVVKSEQWISEHQWLLSRDKLMADYIRQFEADLSDETKTWVKQDLIEKVINPKLEELDSFIAKELELVKEKFKQHRSGEEDYAESWVFSSVSPLKTDDDSGGGLNLGMVGLGLVMIPGLFFGPFLATIAGIIGAGMAGFGAAGVFDIDGRIRRKLIEEGMKQFQNSEDDRLHKVGEAIRSEFTQRIDEFSEVIKNTLSVYENDIERLIKLNSQSKEQHTSEMEWLNQQRERLQEIQQEINQILSV